MTPEQAVTYWQEQAIKRVGVSRLNAVFEVRFAFATDGGVFRASFNDVVSADIAFPPSSDAFSAALNLLPSVGANGTKVKGVLRGPYEVEFMGANAGQVVPPLLIDGTELNPPQEVIPARLQQGDTGDYWGEVLQYWENHGDVDDLELRSLRCAYDLVSLRLAKLAEEYDVQSGQVNTVMEKRSQRYAQFKDREASIARALSEKTSILNMGSRRPFRGQVAATTNGLPLGMLEIDPITGRPR